MGVLSRACDAANSSLDPAAGALNPGLAVSYDGKSGPKVQMKVVLTQVGVQKTLGAKPADMKDDKWKDLDQKALSAIQLSLSIDVLREILNETSASSLCKKLETLYMKKSLANKLRLKERLYTIRMAEGVRTWLTET